MLSATIMSTSDLQIVSEHPMSLSECPLWHPQEKALYWIDINGCAVHRHNPENGNHVKWTMPSEPGCIAWCLSGGMVVALRSGIVLLDTRTGDISSILRAPYDLSTQRFNDGRCDAAGRLWVGTLYEPRDGPLGALYCVERDAIRDSGNRVTVSNGVAFSTDNTTLFHADTTAHVISAFHFDVATGTISGRRIFQEFSKDRSADYGGRPDGAAVDSENCYWCAMFEGGRLLRFSPAGELLQEIKLPVRCPTMIAFGGPDFKTLYITTARHNRPAAELDKHPLSGHILSLRVDIPGLPEHPYIK